ncbi:hypothetical protein [Streptomyces sp. NPDC052496]|uniref:hypothetical protein n=1 Tax=Streptomyces sp. NPDC052496 TaxID=3154951 RepID=UPI0034323E37
MVEQQAGITALLLHHVYALLVDDQHVRGVLPMPPTAEAVRVVLGDKGEYAPVAPSPRCRRPCRHRSTRSG